MPKLFSQLAAAMTEIHSSFSQKHVLGSALKWGNELLASKSSAIWLHSGSDLRIYFRTYAGKSRLGSVKMSKTQGWETWIAVSGKSLLMNEPTHLPYLGSVDNFMVCPLKSGSKSIGVLQVLNHRRSKPFTSSQLHLLEVLAGQTAQALVNAKAFAKQQAFLTEQKKQLLSTSAQLRKANEKLLSSDQIKSENITMVAHELRSPITSIIGFAKILSHSKQVVLSGEQADACGIILKNAQQIQRLISDLLDLTKLELGKMEMHFETISCRELFQEAVYSIQGSETIEKQRILLELQSEDIFVTGDRLRLLQVLTNLLSNALKYSPAESPVFSRYACDHRQVVFSIEDLGAPLEPEQRQRVFEKFYRLKKNPLEKISGSGLGLAICQIAIHNHGGTIWNETGPLGGNVFCFRLPRVVSPGLPPLAGHGLGQG